MTPMINEHPTRADARILTSEAQTRVTNESAAIVEYCASDSSEDRYGSVIDARGWDTSHFERAGGPILFAHDYSAPPVAKTLKVTKTDRGLFLTVQFAITQSERAAEIYRLVRDGFLSGISVGFLPLKTEKFSASTVPSHLAENVKYVRQELLEASVVGVPANRFSLAKAVADGRLSDRTAACIRSFVNGALTRSNRWPTAEDWQPSQRMVEGLDALIRRRKVEETARRWKP